MMKTLRVWLGTLGLLIGIAVLPAQAVPVTVTQDVTFSEVLPFGTFTTGELTPGAWSSSFPFTTIDQITSIRFFFESTDEDYVNGPTGGTPAVELSVMTDANARFSIGSVEHLVPSISLSAATQPYFDTVRALLLDGALTVKVGAYESFNGFSKPMMLDALSTLRVELNGDVPAQPTAVPEPATVALLGAGLIGIARRVRRPNSRQAE